MDAIGTLSDGVERQLQAAARDFSQTAMSNARKSLRDRLRSDEGKEILAEIRTQFLDRLVQTPVFELLEDANALPQDEIFALVPQVLDHNRVRPEVQAAIAGEIASFLELEGARSGRDILDEAGLLEDFFASRGFKSWIAKVAGT